MSELLNPVFSYLLYLSLFPPIGKTDNGKWSVNSQMLIFPLQDFLLHAHLNACVLARLCVFYVCACIYGRRWEYKASLPVGGIQWAEGGDCRRSEAVGGVGEAVCLCVCVPQANRPDKIRVKGAQLEAFLS